MKDQAAPPAPQPTESEAIVAAQREAPGAPQAAPVPLPVEVAADLPPKDPGREGDHFAKASIAIKAPIDQVWDALVTPALIKQYMSGADVVSDWKEGSSIAWSGDYQGKKYEDKGKVIKFSPPHELKYSHFSPLSGEADLPENYHTVTIELTQQEETTVLSLTQDKNPSESAKEHSAKMWQGMLDALKKMLES